MLDVLISQIFFLFFKFECRVSTFMFMLDFLVTKSYDEQGQLNHMMSSIIKRQSSLPEASMVQATSSREIKQLSHLVENQQCSCRCKKENKN